ncbi:hypothetical protein [Flavobacterium crassostreae]|uniref:Uncharacterized protein n=1 Tax=Flavobacterium crassostreae TaxID=1763534 RepID=A0A1B9E7T9_9FLAO|nr:hypothetical protein [Flavobacterium crassostreae]OCB77971.1 hypothetical protein LPBF_03215 [Flavobacterium crassostreae]
MFTKSELINLKTSFGNAYPDYFKQLEACNTQQELADTYEKIKADAFEKAKPFLAEGDDPTGFPAIALTTQQYNNLISAQGDNIKVYVTAMINTAQLIQPSFNVGQTVASLMGGGITAIGTIAGAAFGEGIVGGMVATLAVAAGVEAVTVAGLVTLIAVAIIAIIIPIIYFMLKPACCFVVVLNETNNQLNWVDDYNVHGKPIGHTPFISAAIDIPQPIPGAGRYVYCGLVQTDKRDAALVGTQYGFTYSGNSGAYKANFGVECPLTSLYVDNNCFCEIGSSSEDAANQTDSKNVLSYTASSVNPKLDVSINCNSGSGYVAYYIARVKDGSLN